MLFIISPGPMIKKWDLTPDFSLTAVKSDNFELKKQHLKRFHCHIQKLFSIVSYHFRYETHIKSMVNALKYQTLVACQKCLD